ncbi:acetyl-CoA synthetase-like protein [Rhizopus microsporus ATCC 52813]|uniref:Acetyl-CoA synthetase-like protein n=1 Tax=Rhizopus microsporus ATCC 52813 TaxID=1340429 RepID=A0A2G4T0B3_RHIZD|nr:acetyl-CoA synthetase-like protein [Rhizopus microsporus ATCC 52813]PHZ14437.1 acetyl-CoA synthetase-like protein [Rhizopus microsporus ATCC 52813]
MTGPLSLTQAVDATKQASGRSPIVFQGGSLKVGDTDGITLFDLLFTEKYSKKNLDQIAFAEASNPKKHITYRQFKEDVLKCAAGLRYEYGIQHGDVVALCSPNSLQYPVLFFAVIAAGGIVSSILHTTNSSEEEIYQNICSSKPRLMIMHHSLMKVALDYLKITGMPETSILMITPCACNESCDYAHRPIVDTTLFSRGRLDQPYPYTRHDLVNTPCCFYYSSGTTGQSKVIMITQSSLVHCFLNTTDRAIPLKALAISFVSFTSSFAYYLIGGVFFGFTTYIVEDFQTSAEEICKLIEGLGINCMIVPPYIISILVKQQDICRNYDLSSLLRVDVCGAFIDTNTINRVREELGILIMNTYGMSECFSIFQSCVEYTLAGSTGSLRPEVLARIVDEDGNDLPIDHEVELRVKSRAMTLGYYNNPEESAALFDEQGYLKTRDIFKVDKSGLFYYVSRMKEMIKSRFTTFFPQEIEQILIQHPLVIDCAVIGIYSKEEMAELPNAYVILRGVDKYNLLKEIQDYVNSQLPEYKWLHGVFEVQSLPRTGSGKVQRFKLQRMAARNEI